MREPSHRIEHEPGGPLRLTLRGIFDLETTEALLIDLSPALEKEGPRARVLEDISAVEYFSLKARTRAFGALKTMQYDKWAIYGYSTFVGSLISGLVRTTGRGVVRFFPDEAAARAWLKEP